MEKNEKNVVIQQAQSECVFKFAHGSIPDFTLLGMTSVFVLPL